jgi:acetyl esterase/lipase
MQILQNIPYSTHTARANLFDLMHPEPGRPLPCVIHFHGGGWRMFGKHLPETEFLARAGFAVVSANYRFVHEAYFPAQLEDIQALLTHLHSNSSQYAIQPDRIFAWGISAGGHLAGLLGALGLVQAAALVCAPTDLSNPQDWKLEYAQGGAFDWLLGKRADTSPEPAKAASPVHVVSEKSAPMLLLHGTSDDLVVFAQAKALAQKLEQHGVACELEPIEGGNHFINETHTELLEQKIQAFFAKQVSKNSGQKTEPS